MQAKEIFFKRDLKSLHIKGDEDGGDDRKRLKLDMLLYKTTKQLLIISQIFLCAPPGVNKPKVLFLTTMQERLLYRIHIAWCIGCFLVVAGCIYNEYTTSNVELPTVQKPLYVSEYLVYLAHMLEIILSRYIYQDMFWSFHDFFIVFDRQLLDHKLSINYLPLHAFINKQMFLVLLHLIFTLIIDYYYCARIWLNFFRTNMVYILPNMVIHISLIHYYALIFMIDERLEKLYQLLEKLLLQSLNLDVWPLREQLHCLRNLYARLEQFTRDVNDAFSYTIVLVYFGSYLNICVNIFLLYKSFNAWSESDLVLTAFSMGWVLMHAGKMILILYYNQGVQDKKSKASVLLSTFRHEKLVVEPTVRHFILQLMADTRSNVICGLAALNMNFITSLLVAISTLFIFLVQYDITFEALAKTHDQATPYMQQR